MGLLINLSLKKEDLDKLPPEAFFEGKTAKYLSLSISVDDKVDKFGNNVSCTLAQSKEEREAKKPRVYLGNGKVVFVRQPVLTAKECQDNESDEAF